MLAKLWWRRPSADRSSSPSPSRLRCLVSSVASSLVAPPTVALVLAVALVVVGLPGPGPVTAQVACDTAPVAVDDAFTASVGSTVMVDLVANDTDPDGDPLTVTVTATTCDGPPVSAALNLGDGTVLFTGPAGFAGTCTIDYAVSDGVSSAGATATVTFTDSGSSGPPGGGPLLGVPDQSVDGCEAGTKPGQICCWRELLRGLTGGNPNPLVYDRYGDETPAALLDNSGSQNIGLLCRTAKYVKEGDPTWLEEYHDLQTGSVGWSGTELFSPVYGSWIAAANLVALDQARERNHPGLEAKAERWLRTYWALQTLVAASGPSTGATMVVGGGAYQTPGLDALWDGPTAGIAATRAGGKSLVDTDGVGGGDTPQSLLNGVYQANHMLVALAADWPQRAFGGEEMAGDDFYSGLRTALLLGGDDYRAPDATVDLEAAELPAALFGLTEAERDALRALLAAPGSDPATFDAVVAMVDTAPSCALSLLRTADGTISWFGTDSTPQPICNRNTSPFHAVRIDAAGAVTYLSPGGTGGGQASSSDQTYRSGDQICASGVDVGGAFDECIDVPGGSVVYQLTFTPGAGLQVVEFNPAAAPPSIILVAQPAGVTAAPGGTVRFLVDAVGPEPLGYQWRKNGVALTDGVGASGVAISGATTEALTLTGIGAGDAGTYSVRVSAPGAVSVTSDDAPLTVSTTVAGAVTDAFLLDSPDRAPGLPLAGTLTETGGRTWLAYPGAIFEGPSGGDGAVTHQALGSGDSVMAAVEFDPDQTPSAPVLRLEGDVRVDGEGWVGLGFSRSASGGLWDDGRVWMFARADGSHQVRASGTDFDPLVGGPSDAFTAGAFHRLELEVDTVEETVSAWVAGEQVLFRSPLPPGVGFAAGPGVDTVLDVSHAAVHLNVLGGGASGRLAFDDLRLESLATETRNRRPYSGAPAPVPGSVQAELYDLGGPGIGYQDADGVNTGNWGRDRAPWETVDLLRFDATTTTVVDSMEPGEWLEWTLDPTTTGPFQVVLEAASSTPGARYELRFEGALLGEIAVPDTGGVYQDAVLGPVDLPVEGVLRLTVLGGGGRIDRLRIEPWQDPAPAPVATDDVIVLPDTPGVEVFSIPVIDVLDDDFPSAAELEIVELPDLFTRLSADGSAILFYPQASFWVDGFDRFDYGVASLADPTLTDSATVTVLAGGIAADDEAFVTYCSGSTAPALTIPFAELLDGDLPPGQVQVSGVTTGPAFGAVTQNPTSFTYTPTAAFCSAPADGFTYEIELAMQPSITATGTVTVFGSNPVTAVDDEIVWAWPGNDTSLLSISWALLELNDGAAGGGPIEVAAIESCQFCDALQPDVNSTNMRPDADFWTRGWDRLAYRVQLEGQPAVSATAEILVLAAPKVTDETLVVPFDPGQPVSIPVSDLLANDGPAGQIGLFGVSDGDHGTASVIGSVLEYVPGDGFWEDGVDTLTYDVWFNDDSRAAGPGQVSLVASTAIQAHDDAGRWQAGEPYLFFSYPSLLDDDTPAGLLRDRATLVSQPVHGGDAYAYECSGAQNEPCPVIRYEAPASGFPAQGWDAFDVSVSLAPPVAGPSNPTATSTVWVFDGPVPPLGAAADTVMVEADAATEIPVAQELLTNDTGTGLVLGTVVRPPLHGSLDTSDPTRLVYLPDPGFTGADSFTYTAADSIGRETTPAVVTVAVEAFVEATDDRALVEPGSAGLGLPESFLVANDRGAPGPLAVVAVGAAAGLAPSHGTVTELGGEILYEPGPGFADAGGDAFAYRVELVDRPGVTATARVRLDSAGCASGDAFADGFEGGSLVPWDGFTVAGAGALAIDQAYALDGALGLAAWISAIRGGTHADTRLSVDDVLTAPSRSVRVSWRFDPSELSMSTGDSHPVLVASHPSGAVASLQLRSAGDQSWEVNLRARLDDDSWSFGPWVALPASDRKDGSSPAGTLLAVEWTAAEAPGTDDGVVRLFVDHLLAAELTDLDTDTRSVERFRLGAPYGIDDNTWGIQRLDAVTTCGHPRDRRFVYDAFDGGDLAAWSTRIQGAGDLVVTPAAGLEGPDATDPTDDRGLEVQVDPATASLWIERDVDPEGDGGETHTWSRFLVDADALTLADGDVFPLHAGMDAAGNSWVLQLRSEAGGRELSLWVRQADGSWAFGPWTPLPAGVQEVRVEWRAASGSKLDDGLGRLWIGDGPPVEVTGVANQGRTVETLRLGALYGIDAGTAGTLRLDRVELWRGVAEGSDR